MSAIAALSPEAKVLLLIAIFYVAFAVFVIGVNIGRLK